MKEEDCRSNQTIMYIREKLKVSYRNLLGLVGATESTLFINAGSAVRSHKKTDGSAYGPSGGQNRNSSFQQGF